MQIPQPVRLLAEEANAYVPISAAFERVERSSLRRVPHEGVRKPPGGDDRASAAARARLCRRGGGRGAVAHRREGPERGDMGDVPRVGSEDVHGRLLALGMTPYEEPVAAAMVLFAPPDPAPGEVKVTRVETLEQYRRSLEIATEAFRMDDAQRAAALAEAPRSFRHLSSGRGDSFLAWIDGEPVATGTATYAGAGVVMNGGFTIPSARGRGAYRALVRARWDEAVLRGTPALATQAGSMSRPILERLGFHTISEIRILLDSLS
jgi:hypothetical protein